MTFHRLGRSWAVRIGFGAAMVASVLGATAQPSLAMPRGLPMVVVAKDFQFLGVPGRLPAAEYNLRFLNISRTEEHEFVAVNLGPTCSRTITSVEAAKTLISNTQADGAFEAACPGGAFEGSAFAKAGDRDRETVTLTPGRTLYFCGVPDEDGTPHFELGMIGFINVFALPFGR